MIPIATFRSKGSHHGDRFEEDGKTWELQRHVSFVDCPGHDILMATMLNGAAVSPVTLSLTFPPILTWVDGIKC